MPYNGSETWAVEAGIWKGVSFFYSEQNKLLPLSRAGSLTQLCPFSVMFFLNMKCLVVIFNINAIFNLSLGTITVYFLIKPSVY